MIKKLYVLTVISFLVFNISYSQDLLSYAVERSGIAMDNGVKKSVKKGETSVSEASSILNSVLDVALNIQTEDTRDFEKAIQNAGNTKSKIDLFTKMVRLNY